MPRSDLKGTLASAYSSDEEPKYVSLSPNGMSEMWAVGGVAFMIPAVPPDASLELQFALRARRNALLTGQCEECGAFFDPKTTDAVRGVGIAGAYVPHRANCAASDEAAEPLYVNYISDHSDQTVPEALDAASRRTREQLDSNMRFRTELSVEIYEDWAQELLDRNLDRDVVAVCDHLGANVAQTWNMLLGYNRWYCDECWEYLAFDVARGRFATSMIEEFTCDYCRRYVSTLQLLVVRVGNFVLRGGMCRRCSAKSNPANTGQDVNSGGRDV